MNIKTTYVGRLPNGVNGIWCGFKPKDIEVIEENHFLYPEVNKKLQRKNTSEIYDFVWLKDGDNENNYIEVDI